MATNQELTSQAPAKASLSKKKNKFFVVLSVGEKEIIIIDNNIILIKRVASIGHHLDKINMNYSYKSDYFWQFCDAFRPKLA